MKNYMKLLGAAVGMALATPASAVVVTSIRIENAIPTWLQVAELQAFQGSTNVALATAGATASGSGDYTGATPPFNAIDGNTSGAYPDIYHSDGTGADEFLLITLAQAYDVTTLTIFGRTDSFSDRDLYTYTLFDGQTAVGTGTLDARGAGSSATVTFGGASAVPEPASWAMMLTGFGLVGGALRSRRAAHTGVARA